MSHPVRPLPSGAALADRCRQALVAAARAEGRFARDDLRRAARRFVKRHRRDAGYLRWVLQSVAANAALALSLLGLGLAPTPAAAKSTFFVERMGAANPLAGQTVGYFAGPTAGDLDGDGDLDLVSANEVGAIAYFQNTSSTVGPAFISRTGALNPLGAFVVAPSAVTHLADVDADGDLDVVASNGVEGRMSFLENTGSSANPAFIARTGVANPFPAAAVVSWAGLCHGDLDGDGDVDFLLGSGLWIENTGEPQAPAFVERTGAANPFSSLPGFGLASPALIDLDRDGDLDLVYSQTSSLTFAENTGTPLSPAFVVRPGLASPWAGIALGDNNARPALGDYDRDGDLDMIAGTDPGTFRYFENRAGAFRERTGADDPLAALPPAQFISATLGDVDRDGDLDIVSGEFYGSLRFFANTGSAVAPAFVERTGAQNPFAVHPTAYYISPVLADLDGDGDLDVVVGRYDGRIGYLENTSAVATPAFVVRAGAENPMSAIVSPYRLAPALADLDGDGDLDLVFASEATRVDGSLAYYENTGTPSQPAFVARTGSASPLGGFSATEAARVALGDVDGDGDVDAVVGRFDGSFTLLENRGTRRAPRFQAVTGSRNAVAGASVGERALPALGDLDGDGDADLVSGATFASLRFFENAGVAPTLIDANLIPTSANPTRQAYSPFAPFFGTESPALGDLDSDGDLDLVTFGANAAFRYLENTGSRLRPSFVGRSGAQSPVDGVATFLPGAPLASASLVDLDGDGDLDLFGPIGSAGSSTSAIAEIAYLENTGDAGVPAFALRQFAANPLDAVATGISGVKPLAFGDLDGDGDSDVVMGVAGSPGPLLLLENTGTRTSPAFVRRTGAANPLSGLGGLRNQDGDQPSNFGAPNPVLGDFDADGDLDLVYEGFGESPASSNMLVMLENTGTAKSPAFVERTGASSPLLFPGVLAGPEPWWRGLTAGDLDGDGDADLVEGSHVSLTFSPPPLRVFLLPEPLRGAALAIGALALRLFAGRRRGRPGGRRDDRA